MSHWAEVQTNLKDIKMLEKAARLLGCEVKYNTIARGYAYNKLKADLVITPPGSPYDVAVNKHKTGLTLVTDWFRGHVEKTLGKDYGLLKQAYAVLVIKNMASVLQAETKEEIDQDGNINIILVPQNN